MYLGKYFVHFLNKSFVHFLEKNFVHYRIDFVYFSKYFVHFGKHILNLSATVSTTKKLENIYQHIFCIEIKNKL